MLKNPRAGSLWASSTASSGLVLVGWRTWIEIEPGGQMGVSPPKIGVSGGPWYSLAQITVVGRYSTFRRISSLFFGLWGKMHDCTNQKMYHSRRAD